MPDHANGEYVGPMKTVAQVLVGAGPDGMLPPGALALNPVSGTGWFRKVRLMRRDPTIGLMRDMYTAGILAGEWTVEAEHDDFQDAVKDIEESFMPLRVQFLRDALRGFLDFGWQPYEIVKEQREDGTFVVTKMKGLLQDLSTILVDYYGQLLGIRNIAIHNVLNPNPVYLFRGDCCVLYRDAEGTNWYSEPLMRRLERPYDSWNECDDGARRFDVKVAGSHWVVYYPMGTSVQRDANTDKVIGERDNVDIANDILRALTSSGKVAVPSALLSQVDDLNSFNPSNAAWRVELLSPQTQQGAFVERARYLDSLKSRGFGFPERSILEGQFGTKAKAEAHADFAIDNLEMTHREILLLLNQQAVDVLLQLNHGPAYVKKVKITATPLSDAKRAYLKSLYEKRWSSDAGQAIEGDAINWDAVRDLIGVPVREDRKNIGSVSAPAGQQATPGSRKDAYLKRRSPA